VYNSFIILILKRINDSNVAGKALAAAGKAPGCCGRILRRRDHHRLTADAAKPPPDASRASASATGDTVGAAAPKDVSATVPVRSETQLADGSQTPDKPVHSSASGIATHVSGVLKEAVADAEDAAVNAEHAFELAVVHFFEPFYA
jgi:hypothetical protein